MKNEMDDNLDLLDLDDDASIDILPDASPFASPRPKKPWLLIGVGLAIILLATYIIVRTIGSDSSSSMEVDLGAPEIVTVDSVSGEVSDVSDVQPAAVTKPVEEPVQTTPGVPVREVEDRKEVTFNPNKTTVVKPSTAKPKAKVQPAKIGSWYVQFGSYSTRALAESSQKKIKAEHPSLFAGKQFIILAAVLPNGTTTYRLRVAFTNSGEANGFCRNAKSDGLDCYVAK